MLRNIIIINDFGFINGGAGKVAITSAKLLAKQGYNVTFLTAMPPIDKEMTEIGIKVVCLNQKDILSNPNRFQAMYQGIWNAKAAIALEGILSQYRMEETIVHFHCWMKALSCSLWKVMAKSKIKVAVTLHDYFLFCPNGGLFNYQKLIICQKQPSSVSCLLCNCDSRNYLQKIWRFIRQMVQSFWLLRNKNISFISISDLNEKVSRTRLNHISHKWYRLQNPIEINNHSFVNITNNDIYLFVARLSAEKGVELFCQAITELNLKGCVLGDGYLKDSLQKKYPNIAFAGWVSGDKKENLIRKGKALVFPSLWYEGAPLTIIEMKSYGLPCIVPDKCAASEEIVDGKTGFVFESGSITSLKEALIRCENCEIEVLQKNISDSFDPNMYSEDTHLKSLVSIYTDILDSK